LQFGPHASVNLKSGVGMTRGLPAVNGGPPFGPGLAAGRHGGPPGRERR
jgi:hypothetical protein